MGSLAMLFIQYDILITFAPVPITITSRPTVVPYLALKCLLGHNLSCCVFIFKGCKPTTRFLHFISFHRLVLFSSRRIINTIYTKSYRSYQYDSYGFTKLLASGVVVSLAMVQFLGAFLWHGIYHPILGSRAQEYLDVSCQVPWPEQN